MFIFLFHGLPTGLSTSFPQFSTGRYGKPGLWAIPVDFGIPQPIPHEFVFWNT
jgi:hypothetical protein